MVALEGKRPELHKNTPPAFARLIQRSWSRDLSNRPSAPSLVEQLDQLRTQLLTPEELGWLDEPTGHPTSGLQSQPLMRGSPFGSPHISPIVQSAATSRPRSPSGGSQIAGCAVQPPHGRHLARR